MTKREIVKKIVKELIKELGLGEHQFLTNIYLNGISDEKVEKIYKIISEGIKE